MISTAGALSIQARREAIVNAHIQAEALDHNVVSTVGTFWHPRYEFLLLQQLQTARML